MSMPIYRRIDRNVQLLDYECYTMLREQKGLTTSAPSVR
jgi:hypothetical protein